MQTLISASMSRNGRKIRVSQALACFTPRTMALLRQVAVPQPKHPLDFAVVKGGVKSGHWAAQRSATLGLGVTCATRGRPGSSARHITGL